MDPKSELQIFCAQHIPKGTSYKIYYDDSGFGEAHLKEWKSKVTIVIENRPENLTAVGELCMKKKESQKSAAKKILPVLKEVLLTGKTSSNDLPEYQVPDVFSNIVILDIENIPQITSNDTFDTYMIGAFSKFSHHMNNINYWKSICDLYITESAAPNAADFLLTFKAGQLIERYRGKDDLSFTIVTRDKFSSALQEAIVTSGRSCTIVTSLSQL